MYQRLQQTSCDPNLLSLGFPSESPPAGLFISGLVNNNQLFQLSKIDESPTFEVLEEDHLHHKKEEITDNEKSIINQCCTVVDLMPTDSPNFGFRDQKRVHLKNVSILTERRSKVPAADRLSNVSFFGGKYLLLTNSNVQPEPYALSTCSSNIMQKCINVETREHFLCKVVPKNPSGLSLIGAYNKLAAHSDCLSPITEIIVTPSNFYLIFRVNYGNVHTYLIAKERLIETEAAHLFQQMVIAVKHCHTKGIIISSLRLGKFIFVDKDRTKIKLESLEDAVVLEDGQDDSLADKHGCPHYISPEKVEMLQSNIKYSGKATDIWGLGIMLYTMLIGRYPFNDPDHRKLFAKIRKGYFTIPNNLSPNLNSLVRSILQKDLRSRPSCYEILCHPWIVEQSRLEQAPSGLRNHFPSSTSFFQDTFSKVYHMRRTQCVDNNNDDQVVPMLTLPSKKQ